MKEILNLLYEHKKLSKEQSRKILVDISLEKYNASQIASFISVYLMRGISVDELDGFKSALLELCVAVDLEGLETIDVCGTGGDGKNTFNISTTSAFVVAGAGYKVSKHGNYGVSSVCGSSNVLEYLGYRFTNNISRLKTQLDKSNICFLHAPLFHPALKSIGPIRKQLGVKTFFNLLGPLVNPARPTHQLVGVFNLKIMRLYQYLYENSEIKYSILHALDGYDEVSLTGKVKVAQKEKELLFTPQDVNLPQYNPEAIFGGDDVPAAGKIFTDILNGNGTAAQNDVVSINAALAIQTFKPQQSIADCLAEANESIVSGKAKSSFEKLISLS